MLGHNFRVFMMIQNCYTSFCNHYRGPPTNNETDCRDVCQLTYCEACYYSFDPIPPPPQCTYQDILMSPCVGCHCCHREWARCVGHYPSAFQVLH